MIDPPEASLQPEIGRALNRLLSTVRWLEPDASGASVWRDWDNNVHLARAVSEVRGVSTPHVHIQRIRQGAVPDPRGNVIWALGRVLSRNACVDITPDYFYVPAMTSRVDRALDAELERLKGLMQRPAVQGRGLGGRRLHGG